ncbi:Small glutamine-rich tetratricopeptide repeat-containing protein 2 [Spathaspora sp. JA1]|nr:Small glutamine-rich tetratricopeptide repeat-containing protein 2 [Spathaspora sp. JA1]
MTSITNKGIALSIIEFLKQSITNKEISEDYIESMDVAIDCIADAYEVDKDQSSTIKFDGKSLSELIKSSGSTTATTSEKISEVSAETKAKADALKVEGNKAMASRDFQLAIDKYTQAIELDPKNEIYLSNRAAAYSSNLQHAKAVADAEAAIKLNENFSKAYSRLGLAKYALGDAKGSMEAYAKGLEIEGDKKSPAMTKGYETAKNRYEDEQSSVQSTREEAPAGAGAAGGLPDFGSMFGGAGGAGGMPGLADMMNNPQVMQAAQEMMSNPDAMRNLFNNPAIRSMAESMGLGGENAPDLSNIMNNPMFSQFMGGNSNNNRNSEDSS